MKQRKNRITSYVERTENLMNILVRKRQENIKKSMMRPLYQEALKSLFLIIVLLVDTLIPLEIYTKFPNIINILLTLVTLGIFLYVEIYIYNLLWGKNGRWSLEKYKNIQDKIK